MIAIHESRDSTSSPFGVSSQVNNNKQYSIEIDRGNIIEIEKIF